MNGYGYDDFYFSPTRATAGGGYGQPGGPLDPWQAIISQGIEAARDVARGATSEYPYSSPDDPYARQPIGIYAPTTYPAPPPQLPAPIVAGPAPPQPTGGIQLSQTTLMLLVGGVLLFMLGGRRRS